MTIFKDMDDNQYYMTLWTMAFTIIITIIALIAYANSVEDKLMEQLINQGHDPLELSCLFNGSTSMEAPCLLIGQAKAKHIEQTNVPE